MGLLLVVVSALVFWGGSAACIGYGVGRYHETASLTAACNTLIEYGWDVAVKDCIRDLRP